MNTAHVLGFPFFSWNDEPLDDGSPAYTHRQCPVCKVWVHCPGDRGQDYKHWKKEHEGPEDLKQMLRF